MYNKNADFRWHCAKSFNFRFEGDMSEFGGIRRECDLSFFSFGNNNDYYVDDDDDNTNTKYCIITFLRCGWSE